ncbi:hypothetical protein VTO42DRAFT_8242 [Malbranchea cinnamomea]
MQRDAVHVILLPQIISRPTATTHDSPQLSLVGKNRGPGRIPVALPSRLHKNSENLETPSLNWCMLRHAQKTLRLVSSISRDSRQIIIIDQFKASPFVRGRQMVIFRLN